MYAKQINGAWVELKGNIVFSPNVFQTAESLSDEQRALYDVYLIVDLPRPSLQPHQKYGAPIYTVVGTTVERAYSVVNKTSSDLAYDQQVLVASITDATQSRLDEFARTRAYDGILSACTYAASTVEKFKTEGQYCVDKRDETWARLYVIMSEVESGQRPVPTGYADIEPLLPALEWPA